MEVTVIKSRDQRYWIYLLDKLNNTANLNDVLQETLEELCLYFEFGIGFTYETNYQGNLMLNSSYGFYEPSVPGSIDIAEFNDTDLDFMQNEKSVILRGSMEKNQLSLKFAKILSVNSMILVPVFNQEVRLIALVGIGDRRTETRQSDEDLEFVKAVLTTLGTYVKTQMYHQQIETTRQALDSVLNHMGIDVYVNDFNTHEILYLNKSMAEPYGSVDEMIGTICWQSLYEGKTGECDFCPKKHLIDDAGQPTKVYGWDYQRPFDGAWFRVLSSAFPWVDGRMAQVISSVDITENKQNEEIIRKLAEYDVLTGLPNRYRLANDCDTKIPQLSNSKEKRYMLFFDLNKFKEINDTYGHDVGDELLSQVGDFLQNNPLTRERCYRYGGDEFVILCDPMTKGTLEQVIEALQELFSKPLKLKNMELNCSASIGISCTPDDTTLTSELLRMADQAMYQSKKFAKGNNVFVHVYNKGDIITWNEFKNQSSAEPTL